MPITVRFDPTSTSPQAQIIPNVSLFNDGVLSAAQYAALLAGITGISMLTVYTNETRPAANAVGVVPGSTAVQIWNSDDHEPNFSDGTNWYDAAGNLT
jgi:hypothetical protein